MSKEKKCCCVLLSQMRWKLGFAKIMLGGPLISKDLKQKWVSASQLAKAQGYIAQAGVQWGQRKWWVSTVLASLLTPPYSAPLSHLWYLEAFFVHFWNIVNVLYCFSKRGKKWLRIESRCGTFWVYFLSALTTAFTVHGEDIWLIPSPESHDQFSSLLVWTLGDPKEITSSCCAFLPYL